MVTLLFPLRDPILNVQKHAIDKNTIALQLHLDGGGKGLITLSFTSYPTLIPLLVGREPVGEINDAGDTVWYRGFYSKDTVIADDGRVLTMDDLQ